jgi:hypothetical protein
MSPEKLMSVLDYRHMKSCSMTKSAKTPKGGFAVSSHFAICTISNL